MANRIDSTFARLKDEGKAGFVAYVSGGDPTIEKSLEVLRALERAGADVIEVGVPFSDPLADGVVNQMAAQRALEAGATMPKVLELVREFRSQSEVPVVLFTYLNPVYTYGFEAFHHEAAAAGADGVLLLDLPPDEGSRNAELHELPDLKHIRLIAPTTPESRIETLCKASEGFIYYVSREGVTGAQTELSSGIEAQVAAIKRHTDLPVAVGFGISTPEQAAQVAKAADAVVVGSAIVKVVEQNASSPELAAKVEAFVKPLVQAAKSV